MRQTENKIILITRRTRLDDLVARYNTLSQARFYVEHLGADFGDYLAEHEQYRAAVTQAQNSLALLGRLQNVERGFLPNFVFGPQDVVVALGQDGLVANTLKYLDGQPLIGVNPDPARWDGVLLPFQVADLALILPEVFGGKRSLQEVTMAQARLNNGQTLYAVNDLFIGPRSHVSARYRIQLGQRYEEHSSSGLIVSTGLGSTGWLKSLLTGAAAITDALNGRSKPRQPPKPVPWNADQLFFTVREPFPSRTSTANLVYGKISTKQPLQLASRMAEGGVIFSDGIEADFLEFNVGMEAIITPAARKGRLVV